MAYLHMDTDDVNDLATQLARAANEIVDTANALKRSANRLDARWSGGRSDFVIRQIHAAARSAEYAASDANRLGRRVRAEVDEWLEADRTGAGRVLGAVAPLPAPVPVPAAAGRDGQSGDTIDPEDKPTSLLERTDKAGTWIEIGALIVASPFIRISAGATYPGQAIIGGPHWAKKLWGLSPALTHSKGGALAGHIAKGAGQLTVFDLIGPTLSVAQQWLTDIDAYSDDSPRMAAAMALDMFVISAVTMTGTVGGGKLGAVVGGKLGGLIGGGVGTFILPGVGSVAGGAMGASAGAIIGGAAGKIAGGWLAGKALEKWYYGSKWREQLIDIIADFLRTTMTSPQPMTPIPQGGYNL